jgi:hypothetical protein
MRHLLGHLLLPMAAVVVLAAVTTRQRTVGLVVRAAAVVTQSLHYLRLVARAALQRLGKAITVARLFQRRQTQNAAAAAAAVLVQLVEITAFRVAVVVAAAAVMGSLTLLRAPQLPTLAAVVA